MTSIHPEVSRIYTPCRSVNLRSPCISVNLPSLINNVLGRCDRASLEMHLEYEIEWTEVWAGRPWSSEVGDTIRYQERVNPGMYSDTVIEQAWRCNCRQIVTELRTELGVHDRASLEMHFEAEIEWTQRCTWKPRSSEFRDVLGSHEWVSFVMPFEAVIERVWRCNWTPRLRELHTALGGRDRFSLDMHLEIKIEWTQRCTPRLWSSELWDSFAGYVLAWLEEYLEAVDSGGGVTVAETLFISQLEITGM